MMEVTHFLEDVLLPAFAAAAVLTRHLNDYEYFMREFSRVYIF